MRMIFKNNNINFIKIKVTLFAILILCAFASSSWAATYYVSNQGSDSNSGSQSSPWAHCPGMTGWGGSATLHAGDTVYFNSAGTWSGSGSQLLSVTGGVAYIGDEWGTGTRATLQSTGNVSNGVVYFGTDDATYETVLKGFVVNLNNHSGDVISLNRPSTHTMTGATKIVENCIVENGYTATGENHGIAIKAPKYDISNVEVINNIVHDIPGDGIMAYSHYASTVGKISNVTVRGNTVYKTGEASGNQGCGIYVKDQIDTEVVEFNTVYSVPGDGIRVMADPGSINPMNITLRYNLIYNTQKRGIGCEQRGGASQPSVVDIYGNIIYGCSSYGIYFTSQLNGIITARIYNNTVYNNGSSSIQVDNSTANFQVLDIKNNILDSGGSAISAPSGWVTAQSNNISSNPGFKNTSNLPTGFTGTYGNDMEPNNDGLSIVSGSAIDGGIDLGSSFAGAINISGTSMDVTRSSEGTGWDIGAYEKITTDTAGSINLSAPTNLRIVNN